ncbi:MAG: ABC transporter permease [candidate division WS1 bacterium]|jgi:putative ABC transport system permease protein|nr:ABC transporter permease [candidate division WS1 bacterium]
MNWTLIAFKNILRRPIRSILTLAGIAIAVAMLFNLLEFQRGYERGLRGELADLGAHIMIVPRGCPYEAATIVLHGGKWPRYMEQEWYDVVRGTEGIEATTAIIMDAIIRDGGRENLIYMGIDDDYPTLRQSWEYAAGDWFGGEDTVILGSSVARSMDAGVGDTITIVDEPRVMPTQVTVSGILQRTNSQDDGLIFLPQRALQRIFGLEDKLVVILVKVEDVTKTEEIATSLRQASAESDAGMNIFPLSELLNTLTSLLSSTRVFVLAIVAVAFVIGGVGVLTTILMAVYERTREIGMMKAMGAGRADIFRLIWLETLITSAGGGLLGIGLALLSGRAVVALLRVVLPHTPAEFALGMTGSTFAICIGVSVLLGMVAGTWPAWRAARISPIAAIRGGS